MDQLRISVADGKYTVVQPAPNSGDPAHVLRYGEPWLKSLHDIPGGNVVLAMAYEIEELRNRPMATLEATVPYHDLAMRTAAGPEVFHLPCNQGGIDALTRDFLLSMINFIKMAEHLDRFKSLLFYRKDKPPRDEQQFLDALGVAEDQEFSFQNVTNPQLVHAILGLCTESAELAEDLIKVMAGIPLDEVRPNLRRESGDVDWFQELLATATGDPVEQNRVENIERLAKRFPEKFNEADAVARADEALDPVEDYYHRKNVVEPMGRAGVDHGELAGTCDCAASMPGNSPPHHPSCPSYRPPAE